jgi:hypothetical protein
MGKAILRVVEREQKRMREIFSCRGDLRQGAERERPPALESSVLSSGEAETVSGREVSRRDRRHRGLDVEVN